MRQIIKTTEVCRKKTQRREIDEDSRQQKCFLLRLIDRKKKKEDHERGARCTWRSQRGQHKAVFSRQHCSLHCFAVYLLQRRERDDNISFLRTTEEYFSKSVMPGNMRKISVLHSWQVCVLRSKYFHWKLMAQRETGWVLIKEQQLTSQHMLDELLKIQVTPCEEINCCSSCIRICNMSALEAKWRLFFISLNQNGSLSLRADVPWKAEARLYICKRRAAVHLLRAGRRFSTDR